MDAAQISIPHLTFNTQQGWLIDSKNNLSVTSRKIGCPDPTPNRSYGRYSFPETPKGKEIIFCWVKSGLFYTLVLVLENEQGFTVIDNVWSGPETKKKFYDLIAILRGEK
ncbi:MAG: hypothetical protein V1860_01315 [bacterium]